MTDMRSIAAGLRLPELASLGARAIAERAVSDHERRSGTHVELVIEDTVPATVSLPVKIALFRALQEGLSNATRHGGGAGIRVHLDRGRDPGDRLALEVTDAGSGFDPAELETSQGLGLAGIREQAELLGGGFWIGSRPGSGTRLRVWWPLAGSSDTA
jgi:signal transduction histidine kinase